MLVGGRLAVLAFFAGFTLSPGFLGFTAVAGSVRSAYGSHQSAAIGRSFFECQSGSIKAPPGRE